MEPTSSITKKHILQAIAIIVLVSSSISYLLYLLSINFFAAFIITTLLQVVAGYIHNTYIVEKNRKQILLAELDKLEKLSTLLNCVYCDQQNIVTFLPNEVPDFFCDKCKQQNNVKLQFTVARATNTAPNITDFNKIIKEPQTNHNIKL